MASPLIVAADLRRNRHRFTARGLPAHFRTLAGCRLAFTEKGDLLCFSMQAAGRPEDVRISNEAVDLLLTVLDALGCPSVPDCKVTTSHQGVHYWLWTTDGKPLTEERKEIVRVAIERVSRELVAHGASA